MADNTIDTLDIKISSSATQAIKSLDKLIDTITKMEKSLGGLGKINIGGFTGSIKQLSAATNKLDVAKVIRFSSALDSLKASSAGLGAVGGQLQKAASGIEKISNLDFSKLVNIGDFSGFSSLSAGISSFSDAAKKLADIKPTEMNRVIKNVEKLGKIDTGNLRQIATNFTAFTAAINGIPDLSRLADIGTAFQGFSTALSDADKVGANTTKIFTALSQLAASANNIPIVTQTLPALSAEIGRFVSVMSQASGVDAGTVSLITALSGIAGAGGRATKAAAALPALTLGISDFVTAMSRMPTLNSGVVSVIQALAQFSAAGGRAGSAARGLQANIDNLSRSMFGLRGGMGKAAGGLNSFIRNAAALAGVSYGFYAVGNAIRSSIKTASQLTEIQNVIDVTFGNARGQLEAFAATSIQTLGMSELTAKQMAGRFQAMGLALGETQKPMANMSIELTQLAGDMASFYDVNQKVVGQDLEAIFTGQTKPLRKYGIDLTQATLKSWALSKGIDANFKSMTQLEKVQLRYAYVMEQSAYAQGDFARTQGTWANQTRILGQQFQQLGSIIGSGLIAVFLPVVRVVNVLISRIIALARTLGELLGGFFGFKVQTSGGAGFGEIADNAEGAAESAEAAAGGIADTGKAAKKAKKDLNSFVAGWHEVTNMTSNQDTAGGGGGEAGGIGDLGEIEVPNNFDVTVTATDNASPVFERIKARWQELSGLFANGFKIGFGDISVLDSIVQNFTSIGKSLKDIFSDEGVVSAFNSMIDTLVYNAGIKVGSFASIGATILDNITGGAAKYLETAKERIKQYLIDMFDITAETDTIKTRFIEAVADIFTVFRSDTAKQITADIIQIFSDGFMGVTELAAKLGRDITDVILTPITENAGKIKESIENTLGPIETALGTLADSITNTFAKANQIYDEHLKPLFDSIRDGISEIIGNLLDGYNQYVVPVLDGLADRFSQVWDGTIQPLLNNFLELFGSVADLIKAVWENILQPLVNWIGSNIMPIVAPILDAVGNRFLDNFEKIGEILNTFMENGKATIDFLTDVFEGDWGAIWERVQNAFKDIWEGMPDFIKKPIRTIIGIVNTMITGIESGINAVIKGLNGLSIDIPATPFTDAFVLGFDLSTITLPKIPELAKGGVLRKGQMGFLEGDGAEAVVPLEKNTQWISRVADLLSADLSLTLPRYEIPNLTVPDYEADFKARYGGYRINDMPNIEGVIESKINAQMEEYRASVDRQNELISEQNRILSEMNEKGLIFDDNMFTAKYRSSAIKFRKRTGKQLGVMY